MNLARVTAQMAPLSIKLTSPTKKFISQTPGTEKGHRTMKTGALTRSYRQLELSIQRCNLIAVSAIFIFMTSTISVMAKPIERTQLVTDLIIGNVCIGDLPETSRQRTRQIQNGSQILEDWKVEYKGSSDSPSVRPVIRVFRKPIDPKSMQSCRQLKGELVLSGMVERANVLVRLSAPGGREPARMMIEPNALDITVGRVQSGLTPIFGGVLDLSGSKAWINNAESLDWIEGQTGLGSLDIVSWSRKLRGAKIRLTATDPPITVDLSSKNENISLRVPIDGSSTRLLHGRLEGIPPLLKAHKLSFGSFDGEDVRIQAKTVVVERVNGPTHINLHKASISFAHGSFTMPASLVVLKNGGNGTSENIAAKLTTDELMFVDAELQKSAISGTQCETHIGSSAGTHSDKCLVSLSDSSSDLMELSVSHEELNELGFTGILRSLNDSSANFHFKVKDNKTTFSGLIERFKLIAGAVGFQTLP